MATMTETIPQQPVQSYPATSPPETTSSASSPQQEQQQQAPVAMDIVPKKTAETPEIKTVAPEPEVVSPTQEMSKHFDSLDKVMGDFRQLVSQEPKNEKLSKVFASLQDGLGSVVKTGGGGFRLLSKVQEQLKVLSTENEKYKKENLMKTTELDQHRAEIEQNKKEREDRAKHFVSETEAILQQLIPLIGKKEADDMKSSLGSVAHNHQSRQAVNSVARMMAKRIRELEVEKRDLLQRQTTAPEVRDTRLSSIFQSALQQKEQAEADSTAARVPQEAPQLSRKAAPLPHSIPVDPPKRELTFHEVYQQELMQATGVPVSDMDNFARSTQSI